MEILNSGPGRSQTSASHPAFIRDSRSSGLHGLNERVTAVAGALKAKVCQDGGFRLTVSIPMALEEAEEKCLDTLATPAPEKEREKL